MIVTMTNMLKRSGSIRIALEVCRNCYRNPIFVLCIQVMQNTVTWSHNWHHSWIVGTWIILRQKMN